MEKADVPIHSMAVYDADAQTMLGGAPSLQPMQQPLIAEDADMMGMGVEGAAGAQAAQPPHGGNSQSALLALTKTS